MVWAYFYSLWFRMSGKEFLHWSYLCVISLVHAYFKKTKEMYDLKRENI